MNNDILYNIVRGPRTSEKTTILAEGLNQYTFNVSPLATKLRVKKAVEQLFDVKVDKVRIVNIKGKSKRFANRPGKRNNIKKAYVSLASGQEIMFNESA